MSGYTAHASGYTALAAFYDRLTGEEEQRARARQVIRLFGDYGGLPPLVLDLACGSLGLSIDLLRAGADVIGVDASPDMLALAGGRAAAEGFSPLLLCQDMRELDLYGTVGGAVCAMDGLNHLCRTEEVARVLARLFLFIEPGGLFIFDVNTPHKHRHTLADRSFVFEEDDFLCVWRNRLIDKTAEVDMRLDFFVGRGAHYERRTDFVRERAYSLRIWRRLLDGAGFDILAVLDDDTMDPAREDSEKWTFIVRRRQA